MFLGKFLFPKILSISNFAPFFTIFGVITNNFLLILSDG